MYLRISVRIWILPLPVMLVKELILNAVKLLFAFFISYPLAAVLKRIPDAKPWQKNVFIIW